MEWEELVVTEEINRPGALRQLGMDEGALARLAGSQERAERRSGRVSTRLNVTAEMYVISASGEMAGVAR